MMQWLFTWLVLSPDPRLVYENNHALSLLQEESTQALAITKYSELVQQNPENILLYWNLGSSFTVTERYESAHKILDYMEETLSASNPEHEKWLFFVYFNRAGIFQAEKKIEEAIDLYVKALEIYPDSKEATVNLELLMNSQGGGGGDDQQQEDGDSQSKEDQQKQKPQQPKKNPTPKPFKSKDLSKEDVKRILDELKRQEEKIRERLQNDQAEEDSDVKDW